MRKEFNKNYFQPIKYKFNSFTDEAIEYIERELYEGWSIFYILRNIKNGRKNIRDACKSNEKLKQIYLSYMEKRGKLKSTLRKMGIEK